MGRPRLAKHPEAIAAPEPAAPTAKEEAPASSVSKAEAVRQAMGEGLDSLDEIEGFLKSRFGIEMPRAQLSAYKAQTKKKAAGGDESTKPKRGRKPRQMAEMGHVATSKVEAKGDGDLLDALKAIKGLVSAHGVAKVHEMVDLLG